MAEVVWLGAAADHLDQIVAYIEQFDPIAAGEIARRLKMVAASLATFPNRGRPAGNGVREMATVPPFVLRYRVSPDGRVVAILSIRHGRRRPI